MILTPHFYPQAIEETSETTGRSIKMVRWVLKEYSHMGNVLGGPYSREKKSVYEKLTGEQKDILRALVNNVSEQITVIFANFQFIAKRLSLSLSIFVACNCKPLYFFLPRLNN